MKRRSAGAAALGLLLGLQLLLSVVGALSAEPGAGVATPDLEIVRSWIAGADLRKMPVDPGHLAKPGYLLLLRMALPGGGTPEELRRFLVLNAVWTWFGGAVLCLALWARRLSKTSLTIAASLLACLPLRDANDWIVSEPFAIGFAMLFGAALLAGSAGSSALRGGLGVLCAILFVTRPNLSATLLLVALVLTVSARRRVLPETVPIVAGFVAGVLVLFLLGRATGLPLDPGSMTASKTLLFGTAEYLWPPEIEALRSDNPSRTSSSAGLETVGRRWRGFFGHFGPDQLRSLFWRTGHPILSTEQYPSRWRQPLYLAASKLVHRWWWIAGIALSTLAFACASGASSEWRWIPATLVVVIIGQALLFGAETRFVLPIVPLLVLSIALALPTVLPRRAIWVTALLTAGFFAAVAWLVPEVVASDYAVVTGGSALRQRISPVKFRGGDPMTVHVRVLSSAPEVGLEVGGNGDLLFHRVPGSSSPHPAFLTATLSGASLARARTAGLTLEVRSLGDPSGTGFLYFPVVPGFFGPIATLDGGKTLPSGFGGRTSGGFPVWTHDGTD